jgi:hypothetical protein
MAPDGSWAKEQRLSFHLFMSYIIKDTNISTTKKNMDLCLCEKGGWYKNSAVLCCHQKAEQNLNMKLADISIGNVTSYRYGTSQ